MVQEIIQQFVTLWVVIDPIGTVPVFVAVTAGIQSSNRLKVALHAALVAAGVLMFFLVAGQFLIDALGISLPAFQIAGGIILFIFALGMVLGSGDHGHEADEAGDPTSIATYPLALPVMASPMGIVALTLASSRFNDDNSTLALIGVLLLIVMLINWLVLVGSSRILNYVRPELIGVAERVLGILLAALAAQVILTGMAEADLAFLQTGEAPHN